jgi:hypothetical protein
MPSPMPLVEPVISAAFALNIMPSPPRITALNVGLLELRDVSIDTRTNVFGEEIIYN